MVDFGLTASDYANYRAGFPDLLFDRLFEHKIGIPEQTILDIGTGTGTMARGFAKRVSNVIGLDLSESMISRAKEIGKLTNIKNEYLVGNAENTSFDNNFFDVVSAGQCWHWFDGKKATAEVSRILKPGGYVVIAHFDWLPISGNVVAETEALIMAYNSSWDMGGGTGLYPRWLIDLSQGGFHQLETFSFDIDVPYTPEAWRGRIRASAGVGASLEKEAVERFDVELGAILEEKFSTQLLLIPHRLWAVLGKNM